MARNDGPSSRGLSHDQARLGAQTFPDDEVLSANSGPPAGQNMGAAGNLAGGLGGLPPQSANTLPPQPEIMTASAGMGTFENYARQGAGRP